MPIEQHLARGRFHVGPDAQLDLDAGLPSALRDTHRVVEAPYTGEE